MTNSASEIHRRAVIVDGHCDTPYRLLRHNVHLDGRDAQAQLDLHSLQESGITATFFAAYVPPYYAGRGAAKFARRVIELIKAKVARHSDKLRLGTDCAGIRNAKQDGSIGIMIGIEGGHAIEDSLEILRDFHARGAR